MRKRLFRTVADMSTTAAPRITGTPLSEQERGVLQVLVQFAGRVVSRPELARRSGLADRCERRCDAVLVELRRHLGPDAIRTVRARGWILAPAALAAAHELLSILPGT